MPVGFTELARLRAVFALEPCRAGSPRDSVFALDSALANGPRNPTAARFGAILRAILVKSAEDRTRFDPIFEAWVARGEQGLLLRTTSNLGWGAVLEGSPRARGRRWRWRTLAALSSTLLIVGLLGLTLGPHAALSPRSTAGGGTQGAPGTPGGEQLPNSGSDPVRNDTGTSVVSVPTLSVTPGRPVWGGWAPLTLGCVALLHAGGLWFALRRRRWFPLPAPLPALKGPPRAFLPPPPLPGPQLLGPREGEALVWGIGQFVTEEPTRRLDLPATVRATARAAGLPTLRFHPFRHPKEVWLWVDEAADDSTLSRLAAEVELTLRGAGLPVELAHFRGVPDWLARGDGQSFAPNEVDERRDAALVAILTDGRLLARHAEADDLRLRLDALLRGLSHWPKLAFVDFSHGASGLAGLLPKHGLARIEPADLAAFLSNDRSARGPAAGARSDDWVWAAVCALAPASVDEAQAFALRRRLGLQVSPWALQALRAEAPGPPGRLAWGPHDRAKRLNWLRGCEAEAEGGGIATESLLGQALGFWEETYDRALEEIRAQEPGEGLPQTPAGQHLAMERALLKLWRDPAAAARELYPLHSGPLREEIRGHLGRQTPLDRPAPATVQLPWHWEDLRATDRAMLQEMGLGGGMPSPTLRKPGRVWAGLALCLGLAAGSLVAAALSGWAPPRAAPLVAHGLGKPATAREERKLLAAGRWAVTVTAPGTRASQEVAAGSLVTVRWTQQSVTCRTGETMQVSGMTFVRICQGSFTMGTAEGDPRAYSNEHPAHRVTLGEYWIGATEVTRDQLRRLRPERQNNLSQPTLPAANVSWDEAQAACEQVGGRLPTEAEWENAARAGSQKSWSHGDNASSLVDYAWYEANSKGEPRPVATRRANAWGLYDLHGNVWEWVADWYGPYDAKPQVDPTGPRLGTYRVLRGGAFFISPRLLRSAFRFRIEPTFRGWVIGFRCARGPRRQP